MTDTNIKSPIDFVKKPIEESLEEHIDVLKSLNFSSRYAIRISGEYQQPKQYAFIVEKFNRTFFATYNDDKLTLKLIANFVVKNAYTVNYIYNNNSNRKPEIYIVINIITDKGKNVEGITIQKNAKITCIK